MKMTMQIAILLHDIGHGPFATENILEEINHEIITHSI